jgi:methionine sulfoxide reductase heme-binding subunit
VELDMNTKVQSSKTKSSFLSSKIIPAIIAVLVLAIVMASTLLLQMPAFSQPANFLASLFAVDSQQIMWYITRAAGMTAYLVLWFSVFWGLAVPSKILDRLLHRTFTYDFHEFVSLLAIGFTLLHMVVLMFDHYMPYNGFQILIPFLSPYRPLWIGIGVIGFYLMVLVSVTFYMRSRIGAKAFRTIHLFSFLAYIGVTLHGFFSGTDTPLVSVMAMYVITFGITVLLTLYWLGVLIANQKRRNSSASVKPLANAKPQTAVVQPSFAERSRRR